MPRKSGFKHSQETIEKIRQSKVGKKRPDMIGNTIMVGHTPWNKGESWSDETKRKISETNKRLGIEPKQKYRGLGEDAPNWRGGITNPNKLERRKFDILVPEILRRDNYTCQICDSYSGYLHVDHIKSWAKYPELRLDADNCRTVCRPCHYYLTFKRKMPASSRWGITRSTKTWQAPKNT